VLYLVGDNVTVGLPQQVLTHSPKSPRTRAMRGREPVFRGDTGPGTIYSAAPHAERLMLNGSVLVVEKDREVTALVIETLTDEGLVVSTLSDIQLAAIQATVIRLEPNVVLLDGASSAGYGQSWCTAAWLSERDRRTPVVMFTDHARDLAEAQLGESARSQRAAFAGIVAKPFDLQVLIDVVASAFQHPTSRDQSRPVPQFSGPGHTSGSCRLLDAGGHGRFHSQPNA
jgi:CheY-like chemotaxis protein